MLKKLALEFGYDDVMDFLEAECTDSVIPAICTSCSISGTGEPDLRDGHCDSCGAPTLQSALSLAGVI